MFTSFAVLIAGIWLAIDSQEAPSTTLTLIFGVVIIVLALVDLMPVLRRRV